MTDKEKLKERRACLTHSAGTLSVMAGEDGAGGAETAALAEPSGLFMLWRIRKQREWRRLAYTSLLLLVQSGSLAPGMEPLVVRVGFPS